MADLIHEADEASYPAEVERHFARLRGRAHPGRLTHLDFLLARQWQEEGIPLDVALRGLEDAFAAFKSRHGAGDAIGSLAYCTPYVRRAWRDARGGRLARPAPEPPVDAKALLRAHDNLIQELKNALQVVLHQEPALPRSAGLLERVLIEIDGLGPELSSFDGARLERCEQRLRELESELLRQLRVELAGSRLEVLERELKASLAEYRDRMTPEAFAMTFERALGRAILERLRLPRLTLLAGAG